MFTLKKRCYFCRKPAVVQGDYYEPHFDGSSRWKRVHLCAECDAAARHCYYCSGHHAAYNCEAREAEVLHV